jgi:hypothetical protein
MKSPLKEILISHTSMHDIRKKYTNNFYNLSKHNQRLIDKKIQTDLGLKFKWRMFFDDVYYIEDESKFLLSKIKYGYENSFH